MTALNPQKLYSSKVVGYTVAIHALNTITTV